MLTDIDVIEAIIKDIEKEKNNELHERMELNLKFYKHEHAYRITNSEKYKLKLINLFSNYKEIKSDLLREIAISLEVKK